MKWKDMVYSLTTDTDVNEVTFILSYLEFYVYLFFECFIYHMYFSISFFFISLFHK